MTTNLIEPTAGYIRAQAGLKLLDSSVAAGFDDPRSGYLDLLTEDGRLRLMISRSVAEDLMIDLQQYLSSKPLPAAAVSQALK